MPNNATANNNQVSADGFWRRQFRSPESTTSQTVFDVSFGLVMPVFCFLLDPIVFTSDPGWFGDPLFFNYRIFAYSLAALSMFSLILGLSFRERLGWLNGFLAGILALGGMISLLLGFVLLPYSFVGMFILLGFFGYTPFLSAIVYFRNGYRAYHAAWPALDRPVRAAAFFLGAVVAFGGVWTLNLYRYEVSVFLGWPTESRRFEFD